MGFSASSVCILFVLYLPYASFGLISLHYRANIASHCTLYILMYISHDFECLISIYIEKADPWKCSAYINKSGTALLLFRWLRLSHCPFIQTTTLKPTPYVQMRALCAYINYIPMGILCCYVLGKSWWICEILTSQNKALKTPFICSHLPTPSRTYSLGVGEYECKDTKIFWNMQMKMLKMCKKYARKYKI